MATCILPLAISGSRLSSGAVNAGGTVFLTRPGTANARVTGYQDKDKSEAHTLVGGGYLLDAAGKITVFVDEPCSVRIEDQDGAPVDSFTYEPTVAAGLVEVIGPGWTGIDPDTGQYAAGERTYLSRVLSSLASSLGGVDGKYLAGAGATGRYIKDAVNDGGVSVKSFGAVGNGAADDTTAIQRTIDFVTSLGGGDVVFPPGIYKIATALTVSSAAVTLVGTAASSIKCVSTTAKGINFTAGMAAKNLTVFAFPGSSGAGINHTGSSGGYLENISVSGFANGVTSTKNFTAINCSMSTPGAGEVVSLVGGVVTVIGGSYVSTSGNAFVTSLAILSLNSVAATGGATIGSNGWLYAYGVVGSFSIGGAGTLTIAAGAQGVHHYACQWSDVADSRVAAPVAYSFATSNNFTPLPFETDSIRAVATAGGITVTVNNTAALGFKRPWTLICSNTSGGAVTWTFGANYVLSAAVAPATGNRVNLALIYDPISGKNYEVGRGATAN